MTIPRPTSDSLPPGAPRIVRAENDQLTDAAGHKVIDLFSGNGAVLLGHANPRIAAAIKTQLDAVWLTGGLPTPIHDHARAALEALLPATHAVVRFYSTGMEAAEFAMRLARVATSRSDFIGFSRSMHGKSTATAPLGWDNAFQLPTIIRLELGEQPDTLARLEAAIAPRTVAAVFVEPVLGTGGGHVLPRGLLAKAIELCRQHGTLAVFDEILTGFHRTGPRFIFETLPSPPDVLLLGKALGNGFPVSAVVARRDIAVTPAMLPGSTFADNPLAAAAVSATLTELASHPALADTAARIANATTSALADLPGATLRGRGALWMLELPQALSPAKLAATLYARGVFLSYTGPCLRILPALTVDPARLARALSTIRTAIEEALRA